MTWREIMEKYVPSLGTHCIHFNIINNITLVFCSIHVTIHFSPKRQASAVNGSQDLHTYWRFYNSLNTLSKIFSHSKHDNGVDCYDCEIQTPVNALCSHRRDISLCTILHHAITLKDLEHS